MFLSSEYLARRSGGGATTVATVSILAAHIITNMSHLVKKEYLKIENQIDILVQL